MDPADPTVQAQSSERHAYPSGRRADEMTRPSPRGKRLQGDWHRQRAVTNHRLTVGSKRAGSPRWITALDHGTESPHSVAPSFTQPYPRLTMPAGEDDMTFSPELIARLQQDLQDDFDEELELEFEDDPSRVAGSEATTTDAEGSLARPTYFRELFRLQAELVKLQDWVAATGEKLLIVFEGRDAAGKGGVIKRITQRLNPRVCRVVALPAPNDRERTQWYFQRYVQHLPAAGEIVLFDRSWYNRAGVERVMGFCSEDEVEEFFRSVPEFERMLVRSGIRLLKYWFSITDDEQYARFVARLHDPLKQWKFSPMDLQSRVRWEAYTKAKEAMLERTHIAQAPWWVVHAVDKKRARLNCIAHLLSQVPYHDIEHPPIELPPRVRNPDYTRHPIPEKLYVPEVY
jgi:polyphosphate kinase